MGKAALVAAMVMLAIPAGARADLTSTERIGQLRAQLGRVPTDSEAHLTLIEELLRESRAREALSELDLFAALHPSEMRDDLPRARALLMLDREEEAEELLAHHIDAAGGSFRAHWLRARALVRLDRYDEALLEYEEALTYGDTIDIQDERGRLLEQLGHYDRAAAAYERALDAHPGAGILHEALVRTERARHRSDRALAHLDWMIAHGQIAPRFLVLRAELLDELSRPSEAQRARTLALTQAERMWTARRSPLALMERGRALLALGRRSEAIADLEQALRRAPQLSEARRLLDAAHGGAR
jgi:tetratricopeptide (TPR) repeat protein